MYTKEARTLNVKLLPFTEYWGGGESDVGGGVDSKLRLTPHPNLELVSRMENSYLPRNESFRNCPLPPFLFQFCKSNPYCFCGQRSMFWYEKVKKTLSFFCWVGNIHQISILISGYKFLKGRIPSGGKSICSSFFSLHLLYLTDGHDFLKVYDFWITIT